MSKDNPANEEERRAWIEANFRADAAALLIASGKSAGQIAMDALNGTGPCPVLKTKANGTGAHVPTPAPAREPAHAAPLGRM